MAKKRKLKDESHDQPSGPITLPTITKCNLNMPIISLNGTNLSLYDLLPLKNDFNLDEKKILAGNKKNLAETDKYLSNDLIDAILGLMTFGTNYYASSAQVNYELNLWPSLSEEYAMVWQNHEGILLPLCLHNHWIILFISPATNNIKFIDPLQNKTDLLQFEKLINNCEFRVGASLKSNFEAAISQNDSTSCGIFILKYAERIISNQNLMLAFSLDEYKNELMQNILLNAQRIPPQNDKSSKRKRKKRKRKGGGPRKILHDDETDFERRVKLMEELEAQQRADREKELNALMLQKMHLGMYKMANGNVQDYLQFDSPVYTPLLRNGPNIESMYKPPKYEFRDHFDVDAFDTLTNPPHFIKNGIQFDRVKFARLKRTQLSRTEKRLDMNLMSIYDAFREETLKKVKQDDSAFMKQVITSTIHRMSTPTVEGHDLAQEHQELCVLNLQKVIRGRVVQILMRDEIKENMASILQLKALHKADPFGLNTTYGEAMRQISLQDDRELQQETQNEVTEIMDQLEGESLARMFDFLDKEMIRLLDERKIHALMILAQRERRTKEATEAGRRQQEEDDRRINDEIFLQIVGVHQATVDMYLEDMYLETINRTADSNAWEYVLGLARALNEAAYITTQNDGEMENEEMAAELVHCFMLPEMNRIYQRERLDSLASRYTLASHEVTDATFSAQGVINETLNSLGSTIQEHMERGAAAVEGAQFAVDNIIKGAVSSMMKQVYPKKHPTEVERIEQETFKYYQDLPGLKPPEPEETEIEGEQDEDFPEEEFEPVSPQHSIHSVQALTELAIVDPSSEIEILSDEERDEILAEVEATLEALPPVIIPVIPQYSHELGEKSMQLTFGGEVESDVVKLYQEATAEVKDLFTETAKLFKPPEKEESSEEETDEELEELRGIP